MADLPDEDKPQDVARFNRLARNMQLFEDARNAIGGFLTDFAFFESISLTAALRSLSTDVTVIDHLPELMDISNRLKLLTYLGRAHRLPEQLKRDIRAVVKVADVLRQCRNDIAHGAATLIAPFFTDPNTDDITAGVQRPRSRRVAPEAPLTASELAALYREWTHDVPTIRKWTDIAVQLQQATHQLADKLGRHQHAEPWQQVIIRTIEMPVRDKKLATQGPEGA
jgi:hypothetical protein